MQNNNQIESNNYLDERNINSENNLIVVEEQKLRINLEIPSIIDITDEEKAILIDKNEAEINRVKEEALLFELLETKDDCVDKEDFMQNKENLKKMFWYEYKTDFFIKNEEDLQYAKFPDSKVLKYDEYGEVFHYAKNLKNEYEISKVKNDMQHTCEEIKFEKIIWENKNLDFNCKEDFVDFDGFCDFNSAINILEKIKPKKLILYGEEKCLIELYHNYLKLSNEIKDVMILNKEIELKIDVKLSKLETTNEFESLINLKKTDHEFIGAAKFSIIEDHGVYALKVLNTGKIGCFGQLKIDEIKNAIVKKGLKVEINNNVIIVEDEIEVSFSQDKSIIMGEAGDLYNFVADVLYKKMAFLNQ
ncbi:cleavage and polyadenylation specificity factor subunit 2 [Gurleya vavrai]